MMSGQLFWGMILCPWLSGFAVEKCMAAAAKADSDGVIKKAAQDGVVRTIERFLK